MDAVKEDMQVVGVRVEDTKNRLKWKTVIHCGKSRKEKKRRQGNTLIMTVVHHFTSPTKASLSDGDRRALDAARLLRDILSERFPQFMSQVCGSFYTTVGVTTRQNMLTTP